MKIRYMSDLHLEFIEPNKINKFIQNIVPTTLAKQAHSELTDSVEEVCVLAGDIGNPYSENYEIFMNHISTCFKKIFVIAGNHEYYNNNKTIEETNEFLTEYFKETNISFLNNSYEYYNGYCFVGTTLWSRIKNPIYQINDTSVIRDLDYIKYNKLNEECIKFLEDTTKSNDNIIVITHHLPSESLIDDKYKNSYMSNYNQWFYCPMDNFIELNKDKIKCWIYGHTHTPSNKLINNIPFVCNSYGYPNENIFKPLDYFNKSIII